MIHFDRLTKTYRDGERAVHALREVSLEIPAGQFVAVTGPSGCGKTTLLLTAGGMLRPTSGKVSVDGQDLYGLRTSERSRFRAERIGFVFQMFHLIPYLNVLDNVSLGRSGGARERAAAIVSRLGLAERATHYPGELSAGEKQRAALARALLNHPRVILADEPTGNLDAGNAEQVFRILGEFHSAGGTVVVVTHGEAAARHAERVVSMDAGGISSS